MMEIRQPQWQLRRACPICQQGGLALVVCTECSHVALICAEEGSAFPNVWTIAPESAVDAESVRCPQCQGPLLRAFRVATTHEILGSGLLPSDYE